MVNQEALVKLCKRRTETIHQLDAENQKLAGDLERLRRAVLDSGCSIATFDDGAITVRASTERYDNLRKAVLEAGCNIQEKVNTGRVWVESPQGKYVRGITEAFEAKDRALLMVQAELNEAKRLASYDAKRDDEMITQREKEISRLQNQLKRIKELCAQ